MKTTLVAALFTLATAALAAPAAVTVRFTLANSRTQDVKVAVGTVADVNIKAVAAKAVNIGNAKCELSINNSSKVGAVLSANRPNANFNPATLVSRISC
jgi:hypothetical protein